MQSVCLTRHMSALTFCLEATGQNDPKVHFSWKLEQSPKRSKSKISDHNSAQTSFRPDVPGLYVIEVTVRLRNLSVTATLTVNPNCAADSLTPVNTIDVVNGHQGMTVGACFWTANPGVPGRLPLT